MIDVAVVGGGPAGSAAAVACARAGFDTVLFERGAQPETVSDGSEDPEESVGPDVVSLLQALGIDCAACGTPFAGIAVEKRISVFGGIPPIGGFHLRRSWLDPALRAAASHAGATIRTEVEVLGLEQAAGPFRLFTSAGTICARHLVDATGRRLWLTRRLKLSRRRLSPALIAWRDIVCSTDARTGAFGRFRPHAEGWTWLAQVSPRRTVRIQLRRARHTLGSADIPVGGSAPTAHVSTWLGGRRLAGSGWWIVGDAAASLDPAAGWGIAFAIRSGLAAGSAAAASVLNATAQPIIAARYHDALFREFEGRAAALAHQYRQLGIGVLDQP